MTIRKNRQLKRLDDERDRLIGEKAELYSKKHYVGMILTGIACLGLMTGSFAPMGYVFCSSMPVIAGSTRNINTRELFSRSDMKTNFGSAIAHMNSTTDLFSTSHAQGNKSIETINGVINTATRVIGSPGLNSSSLERNLTEFKEMLIKSHDSSVQATKTARYLSGRVDNDMETASNTKNTYAVTTGYSYASAICLVVAIQLFTLIPTRCCACTYKAVVPCNIIGVAVLWTVTGTVIMMALLSSDFCWEPNQNTLNLIKMDVGQKTAYDTMSYYFDCHRSKVLTHQDGMFEMSLPCEYEIGEICETHVFCLTQEPRFCFLKLKKS